MSNKKEDQSTPSTSPLAGKPVPKDLIIDPDKLIEDYHNLQPDLSVAGQRVAFGTSGHRGTSTKGTFQSMHVEAITQAICQIRKEIGVEGPLFLGKDTHCLSDVAQETAVQVLAANNVETYIQQNNGFTPTPAISHKILTFNRENKSIHADGIIVTPSHNPPSDAGIKYNPPHGGPAEDKITKKIEALANSILASGNKEVKKLSSQEIGQTRFIKKTDFAESFIDELDSVIDMQAISKSGITIGVHPLGGAAVEYWKPLAKHYKINLKVVDDIVDPTFSFMTVDHDGKVRMDCSSPFAMASLISLKDNYDIAFGNDPDADRHGIVTPSGGLMNPNHYLAVAIDYLVRYRKDWPSNLKVGKTVVSSLLIDRVVAELDRELFEVPVGFKWFAQGLHEGTLCFGGEESAGASFLCRDGKTPWSTDKDGLIMGLLAAEIKAITGLDPNQYLMRLVEKHGLPAYQRIDSPTTAEVRDRLLAITPEAVQLKDLAGDAVTGIFNKAPGNNMPIGGVVIKSNSAWVAIRPSGTEALLKIYGESVKGSDHLNALLKQIQLELPKLI